MARRRGSTRALVMTPQALSERLPERFLEPTIQDDLVGALRAYLRDLEGWLADQGIAETRDWALAVMTEIGTSPASWYEAWLEESHGDSAQHPGS